MKKKTFTHLLVYSFLIAVSVLMTSEAHAQTPLSYDAYAPVYENGEVPSGPSTLSKTLWSLPAIPFELIRWPTDKLLIAIEKNHLEKKALWLYDWVKDKGISPSAKITSLSHLGGGAEVEFVRLFRQHQEHPDLKIKGWSYWVSGTKRNTGGSIALDRIADTPLNFEQMIDYENRPEEHFYGIGPKSSGGDGAVFSMETTEIKTTLGYAPTPSWNVDAFASYRNINISSGRDGGRGQRGEIATFNPASTPGFFGDSIFSTGLELVHDTRNQGSHSTRGGKRRFALSFNEGLNSSEARYFQYEVEASQYFRLGNDRRVLALNAYGEHQDDLSGGNVPFHQMSKLGGFGANRLSRPLRGYDFNRFFDEGVLGFNLEYRYTIWQYRDLKMDAAIFWDEAQVFDEFSNIELDRFKESYGVGFRVNIASITLLNFEVAHGDEGTHFYVKTSTPF